MRDKLSRSNGSEEYLEALASRVLRFLGVKNSAVGVCFLNKSEMSRLGRKFLRKDKKCVPDVLSFAEPEWLPHPESPKRFLGEIYLNGNLRRRSSKRVPELLVHGLLHILGYTHDKKHDTLKMERLERKLLNRLKAKS